MIDVLTESVVTLTEAARLVPRRRANRPANISTIWRWCIHGVRGIKLESVQIGGSRCTSREALQRFFERLTLQANAQTAPPIDPLAGLSKSRRRQIEAAEKRLAAAGI